MKRHDSFAGGGYWRPADRTGQARSVDEAAYRALYDHQPRRRGLIARLLNTRGNRT